MNDLLIFQCCKQISMKMAKETRNQDVTIMLGGIHTSITSFSSNKPTEMDSSYSVVSPECTLDLPPLPQRMPYKPLSGYLSGHLLACYLDYWVYRQHHTKDYQCWSLNLDTASKKWSKMEPPLHALWFSSAVVSDDKFLIVGGSEVYSDNLRSMNGTVYVQEYSLATKKWASGVPLPYPLFEGCAVNTGAGVVVVGDFEGGFFNAYILDQGLWQPLSPTLFYHATPACASVTLNSEEVIIVISGQNIEYFSFLHNRWINMEPPNVPRSENKPPTLAMSSGRLIIAGGVDLETVGVSDEYEIWDPVKKAWRTKNGKEYFGRVDHAQITLPRSYLQCCC